MRLVAYAAADRALTERIECDPVMMADLGGPLPRESIELIHDKRLAFAQGGGWYFTIVPQGESRPVGTVGLWESDLRGVPIHEMCWMVLPSHQGRGLASEAVRRLIERARAETSIASLHATPNVANGASNAICRKAGFVAVEEVELGYAGRAFRCRHWRLDLRR